jgi:hypothetical protein
MITKGFAAALMLPLLGYGAGAVAAGDTAVQVRPKPPTATTIRPPIVVNLRARREAWRLALIHTPRPKRACYTAHYPDTQWHEAPCGRPLNLVFGPARGAVPEVVGNGDDDIAQPSSPISFGEGSFDSVSGVVSEATINAIAGEGNNGSGFYTLQVNTNFFSTSLCNGHGVPNTVCSGWAQFVFDSSSNQVSSQYWLINYGPTCPSGWGQAASVPNDCYTNGSSAALSPAPKLSELGNLKLTGSASNAVVFNGGAMASAPTGSPFPELASEWGSAEFNIFGDGGAGQAAFNIGSSTQANITVRTQVETATNLAPDCEPGGTTGETNNLNLVSTPAVVQQAQFPSIVFNESSAASNGMASCATSVGDTHITTFNGLYYNFQAAGDYVLADAGPDFVVQARQESGAVVFNNPNVTMNTAVAVRAGTNRIAIYDSPTRVVVNGAAVSLVNNVITTLPGNVMLYRENNLYIIARPSGELVRAQLYNGWMDLTVGLGHRARSSARGLLSSLAGGSLALRNGTVVAQPVATNDLYQRFGRSWLVQPAESLFAEHPIQFSAPIRDIALRDLDPAVVAKAHEACATAGVADAAHLESCTLDVAVLKDTAAVNVFSRHIVRPHFVLKLADRVTPNP